MKTNKIASKRDIAKVFRAAAKQLDISGWRTGNMGSLKTGFCAVGGINHICKKLGVSNDFLRFIVGGMTTTGVIATNFERPYAGYQTVESLIIWFNDEQNKVSGKERVQKALRKAARELEHGGVL